MNNVKEIVKIGVLLFLVVFVAIIVTTTKGKDPLRFDFNLNIELRDKNEFSFPIVNSEYNGEYRNNKGNSVYVLVGKNNDETYRVYFLRNSEPKINIEKLNKKLERLAELYIEGKITKEKYDIEYEKIKIQLNKAQETKKEEYDFKKLQKILQQDISSIYNNLSNENKRNFWASFIDYIEITPEYEYHIQFKN